MIDVRLVVLVPCAMNANISSVKELSPTKLPFNVFSSNCLGSIRFITTILIKSYSAPQLGSRFK